MHWWDYSISAPSPVSALFEFFLYGYQMKTWESGFCRIWNMNNLSKILIKWDILIFNKLMIWTFDKDISWMNWIISGPFQMFWCTLKITWGIGWPERKKNICDSLYITKYKCVMWFSNDVFKPQKFWTLPSGVLKNLQAE